MRKNMWALLALMNYFDTEATEHNDPDTPAENEHDESGSDHGDSAGNGNPNSNAEPNTSTTTPTTSTPSEPAGSPAMRKAMRLIANAVAQGANLTATTSIVASEMITYGISQTINYLWIRTQDNRTDSFGFFGIACKNPFTGMSYNRSVTRSTLVPLAVHAFMLHGQVPHQQPRCRS